MFAKQGIWEIETGKRTREKNGHGPSAYLLGTLMTIHYPEAEDTDRYRMAYATPCPSLVARIPTCRVLGSRTPPAALLNRVMNEATKPLTLEIDRPVVLAKPKWPTQHPLVGTHPT